MEVSRIIGRPRALSQSLVGRQSERERLTEWILGGPAIVQLYGRPGSGKTHLLHSLAALLQARGMPVSWLSAALVPTRPDAVRDLLRNLPEATAADPAVLFIDDFDLHAPLHRVYWDELLPSLHPETRVILSSAEPLEAPRRPSGQHRLSVISLPALEGADARALLSARGVPKARHEPLAKLSGRLPLLLATLAEFAHEQVSDPGTTPHDPQRALGATVHQVLREAPSDEHRQALWAISLPLVLTERLLAGMLDHPRSNECYRWLKSRPYVEQTAEGLVVHRSFREPLLDSLTQQAPVMYRDFLIRAGHFHIARTTKPRNPRDRVASASAHFYVQRRLYPMSLHREAMLRRAQFVDVPRAEDTAAMEALVAAAHGPTNVGLSRYWYARQPERLRVFRDRTGSLGGLVQAIDLGACDRQDAQKDPAVAAALRVMAARATERRRLRPHGRHRQRKQPTLLFRFCATAPDEQGGEAGRAAMFEHVLLQTISAAEASLVLVALPSDQAETGEALVRAGLARTFDDGGFVLDGRHHILLGHDFMDSGLAYWLRHALATAVSGSRGPEVDGIQAAGLDRHTFDHAVRDALEGLLDDAVLDSNPLAGALPYTDEMPARTRIRHWLQEGLTQLARIPGGEAYAHQLQDHYFSEPEPPSEVHTRAQRDQGREQLLAAVQLFVATLWNTHVTGPTPAE